MKAASEKRSQNLDEHKVSKFPKLWAQLMGYNDPASHSFCYTAGSILADQCADMINLKHMGRWASGRCVECYIDETVALKDACMSNSEDHIASASSSAIRKTTRQYNNSATFLTPRAVKSTMSSPPCLEKPPKCSKYVALSRDRDTSTYNSKTIADLHRAEKKRLKKKASSEQQV